MVLPSLAAGLMLAASLPPWGYWILAPLGAGALWWRLDGLRTRTRLLAGWVCGLGLFVPGLFWATSFNWYGGVVLMLVEALALGLAAAASPPGPGRAIALPGAMVLAEALRSSWPFGGLPLGGLALGQAQSPITSADRLGGPLLLVGLVWLCGSAVGLMVTGVAAGRTLRPVAAGALLLGFVAAVAVWGVLAPDGGPATSSLTAAAVQGGGRRGLRASQVDPETVYEAQIHATSEMVGDHGGRRPSLVLWPEDVVALSGTLGENPGIERQLSGLARRLRATLVVGVTSTVSEAAFLNEAVAFGPDGRVVDHYEKVHRVPFGEYVPFRGFFEHLANLSAVPRDAIAGTGDGVLKTPAGKLGTMISYEVFFSDRGRVSVRNGADLLIVPTNTSSYSTGQVPAQEIAAARLQAVAQGRDLVQAAPTGYSAVIDNSGNVIARTSLGERQVIVEEVALRKGRTLYVDFGDLPVTALGAMALILGWVLASRRRHRRASYFHRHV